MMTQDAAVAVFPDHQQAEAAIKKLGESGFPIKHLSIVGKGYHTEEKVLGFYTAGDRIKFWGRRGAFWGGLWGLFFGGMVLTVPVAGQVVALGYITAAILSAVEGAIVVGGLSALGAAIASIGVSQHSVIAYETAIAADGFLVMAHGPAAEMERAQAVLATLNPSSVDLHVGNPLPAE